MAAFSAADLGGTKQKGTLVLCRLGHSIENRARWQQWQCSRAMVLARRDRAYIPQNFYQVIFSLEGSAIPTVLPRSIPIIIVDIAAAVLDHLKIEDEDGQQRSYASYFAVPNEIIIPFALLIGLLFSFRISSAYEKWVKACEVTKQFHGRVCLITSRIAISVCQGSDSEIAGSTRFLGPKAAGTLEMVNEARHSTDTATATAPPSCLPPS